MNLQEFQQKEINIFLDDMQRKMKEDAEKLIFMLDGTNTRVDYQELYDSRTIDYVMNHLLKLNCLKSKRTYDYYHNIDITKYYLAIDEYTFVEIILCENAKNFNSLLYMNLFKGEGEIILNSSSSTNDNYNQLCCKNGEKINYIVDKKSYPSDNCYSEHGVKFYPQDDNSQHDGKRLIDIIGKVDLEKLINKIKEDFGIEKSMIKK